MVDEQKGEQQGFKISDRRKRYEEEAAPPRPEAPQAGPEPEATPPEEQAPGPAEARRFEPQGPPEFAHLISRLAQEALFFMGDIPDPATGKPEPNLGAASWTIDTIDMLRAKTKGNLDGEESRLLEGYLAELRVRFLRASGFLKEGRPTG